LTLSKSTPFLKGDLLNFTILLKMKKLIPILLLFFCLKLSAQDSSYVSIISDSSEWSNYLTGCESQFPGDISCHDRIYKLRFGDDSLYDGFQYKIVEYWPASYDNVNLSLYYDSTNKIPCALIREDSGRVYVKHLYYTALNSGTPVTDKEILLYDFNLVIGDTFFFQDTLVYGWDQPNYFIVNDVDSILTNVGYRKTISLLPTNNNGYLEEMFGGEPAFGLTWIEGIGSNKGLLYNIDYQVISTFGLQWYYFHFMCYSLNGQYVYGSGTCDYPLSVNEQKQHPISIYPNPAAEYVSIDLPITHTKGTMQIYNLQGQLVKSEVINGGGLQNFNISEMSNGVYNLVVYSGANKLLGRQKLVVVK
jgi:hypothetical protein